ncbi:hypothetical protein GGTG_13026 [Gaeumannomyces tritici R3-111a-1]|uniref:Uncharacterized protein n=1 Tax=Gaeumannomyces tritici (strain R3-111a-1) TaxID=644352 RepID=J3PHP5_GAET3|nr:hypothetical protein GGTG_13026 [Gaeumannomyces tritici R3-111a-1]EJT69407.1 hypothetical protein GGTG_13026 [Gaeumannomyces tritici R3-111a-1]
MIYQRPPSESWHKTRQDKKAPSEAEDSRCAIPRKAPEWPAWVRCVFLQRGEKRNKETADRQNNVCSADTTYQVPTIGIAALLHSREASAPKLNSDVNVGSDHSYLKN